MVLILPTVQQGLDIAVVWNLTEGYGDWTLTPVGDIATGNPLESAVFVSLFSDAPATPDYEAPPGDTDPRGFWADAYAGFTLGSNLWQLRRVKIADLQTVLQTAEGYCQSALAWLLTDGVAATVSVTCRMLQPSIMGIYVVITEPTGAVSNFAYGWAWQGIG